MRRETYVVQFREPCASLGHANPLGEHNQLRHITGAGSAAGSAPVRKPSREQLNPFLEDVQYLAGHTEPRTTGLYDRRQKKVTRNIVEQISI